MKHVKWVVALMFLPLCLRAQSTGYVTVSDGARLFYKTSGKPGPGVDTIIAMHGGPGLDLGTIYNDMAAMFGNRHVVIYYDQRGGGRSALPADTTQLYASRQIQDLDDLRKHFKLERVTLVAHSYGPLLAGSYAIAHPASVKSMIFFGPVPPRKGEYSQRYGRNFNARMDSVSRRAMTAANRLQLDSTNTDSVARAGCREYWRIGMRPRLGEPDRTWPLMKADFCETDLRGIRYGARFGTRTTTNSFGDWDLRPALASLRVPLLVIHGEEETIPMDLIEEWITAMPSGMATLMKVPRAAHFPYLERPEIVWPAVEKFLAQRANTHSNTERGGVEVKQVAGRKIGSITTKGNLILLELDSGAVSAHNLFDLDRRTIRFTPSGAGFRAENVALQWDSARGVAMQGNTVRLTKFLFPFSGKTWDTLQVMTTGLIGFGGGYGDLGFDRFVHLKNAGPAMVNKIPLIAAFLKQRMNGTRYVNELDNRVVITWDLTEPTSGQQDVTFVRTPHHFQAVLHRDGRVDLSYREMTARDAVVGVYTVPVGGAPPTRSVDLSSVKPTAAPAPVIFETFHHYGLPGSESMACTVIQALGDRFDFMVWYSDFRVDDQEAGTRSVGDIGQRVQGLGPRMDQGMRSRDYCSQGRLQVTWFQPVWVGAVQAQARHPDGRFAGYNMAVAQIAHELAHRWSTRTRAIVNGDTIELRGPHDPGGLSGATHWPQGVSAPVPFPYSRPVEASIMGGSNWKDNGDGTFTMLANGTMNPASGFSYLELYFMGLLPPSGVPDFFMLRNQRNVGRTPEGNNIVAAEKVPITIRDVIAHNGPRVPAFANAPKAHNTAMVVVTLRGRKPDAAMLSQVDGIGAAWIAYWSKVTGGVSTMTTNTGRRP